ncbi:MAG: glycosyltransferase [Hafnia sp.]
MYNPLVSIVVAAYNAESYIEETLDSCINQRYKNIEIIITDDFSSDKTLGLCRSWIAKQNVEKPEINIKLLPSHTNGGIPKNLNKSLPYCKGDWVKFIGSDDLLLPDAISELIKFVGMYQSGLPAVVFSAFETFGSKVLINRIYPQRWSRCVVNMKAGRLKTHLAMLHLNNLAPSAFINNSLFKDANVKFDETYRLLEDLPLWLYVIYNKEKTVYFNKVIVKYRLHGSQITSQSNTKLNSVLLSDLNRLNKYRMEKGFYFSYWHHKYQLMLNAKKSKHARLLQFIDPIKLLIYFFERIGR